MHTETDMWTPKKKNYYGSKTKRGNSRANRPGSDCIIALNLKEEGRSGKPLKKKNVAPGEE